MKIVNSAYMSQGQAVPSKIYRPPKNNYVLMYLFSINTHTFTYPALPKAISCKQYYSWPMMFSLSLFSKKTWRQWRTCISWARDCVNINWGLELLEHTTYGAYNSVVTVHVQNDAPATRCELSLYYKKKTRQDHDTPWSANKNLIQIRSRTTIHHSTEFTSALTMLKLKNIISSSAFCINNCTIIYI